MSEIIMYLTQKDADLVKAWINAEKHIAWVIKDSQTEYLYRWRAVDEISTVLPQEYCLWHNESGPLNIPSRSRTIPDAEVLNPYAGWSQTLDSLGYTVPWFGANLPGPYFFTFKERGREAPNSIGRSGFHWLGDYFRPIGKGASNETRSWWNRLRRFIKSNSRAVPWPEAGGRNLAYAFDDAYAQHLSGRHLDVNP